jgi:hypothetical protein
MLHKIPEYLVQTDCEDCCNKLRFMGERKAGLQELCREQFGEKFCRCADDATPHNAAAKTPREGSVYPPGSSLEHPKQHRDGRGIPRSQPANDGPADNPHRAIPEPGPGDQRGAGAGPKGHGQGRHPKGQGADPQGALSLRGDARVRR